MARAPNLDGEEALEAGGDVGGGGRRRLVGGAAGEPLDVLLGDDRRRLPHLPTLVQHPLLQLERGGGSSGWRGRENLPVAMRTRARAASRLPPRTASSRAVRPCTSRRARSAPVSASCTAVSRWPPSTASMTGVSPSAPLAPLMSAPAAMRSRAAAVRPEDAASASAPAPLAAPPAGGTRGAGPPAGGEVATCIFDEDAQRVLTQTIQASSSIHSAPSINKRGDMQPESRGATHGLRISSLTRREQTESLF